MDTLRSELREKGIPYASIRKLDNNGVEVRFRDDAARDQAISYIGPRQRDLVLSANGANTMKANLTDARLSEAREYAVQQNITILRNRVNQLGVAEPLVQRQGADRIVVELPGIQDTARAKEILGATATLEFRLVNTNADATAAANGRVPGDSEVTPPRAPTNTTSRRLTSRWIAPAARRCPTSPRTTSASRWRPCSWNIRTAARKTPMVALCW